MTSLWLLKLRVLETARKWWEMHKPVDWSLEKHLLNPTINTCGEDESALARSVASLVKESWQWDDAEPIVRDLYGLVKDMESAKKARPDRHLILRRAEAFLGLRTVSEVPAPIERAKAKGKLHETQQARGTWRQGQRA